MVSKKHKRKQSDKRSKQVIKIVNPPAQQPNKPNTELDSLKTRLLLNF